MMKKTIVQASPKGLLPVDSDLRAGADRDAQSASNASQPLEKPRDRIKAHVDQATIQEMGANALPVSDYPLKKGPVAANTLDLQERGRARVKQG
jgi:hypothetical protein